MNEPHETLIPLRDAVEQATGRRPGISTVMRWCQKPNQYGIRLRSRKVGGLRLTSVEAVNEFIDRTTAAAEGGRVTVSTSKQVKRAHDAAMNELRAAGV
ncbi:DUF1580 domain-containing protein [Roseiconus lacunae]|uniref:DUF1580 domain-containing protein n=1 Tax=Roseiconus lacunae TaxID=2605694 RepID=UPI003F5374DF